MLKLINYPAVIGMALLTISHTNLSSEEKIFSSEKEIKYTNNNFSVNNKKTAINKGNSNNYRLWQLAKTGLSEKAFNFAMKGYAFLKQGNQLSIKNIISIVDFSKPSTQKRLYIVDINEGKVLYNTLVAHGRNSGNEYANEFSNQPESHQSSLGFYITLGTYMGGNGYSLRLTGCEKGINDKAFERDIVIHGAEYVSNDFIHTSGFLGRSYGCPSLPEKFHKEIIDLIKNGTCLFIYHPSKKYFTRSKILNS